MVFQNLLHSLGKLIPKLKRPKRTAWSSMFGVVGTGALTVAFGLWGFAEIASVVLEKETEAFDRGILLAIQEFHRPWMDRVAVGVTFLGEPVVLTVLSLAVGILFLWRQRWGWFASLAIATAGAIGFNFWLKTVFSRARPELWDRIVDVGYYSFPSGHAMISLVVYGWLGYWLASRFPRWRAVILSLTVVAIALIGFSRLYLGVHWPTDVIAGFAAGLAWLVTCILSLEVAQQFPFLKSSTEDRS